jgi:O-antigen ligase
MTTGGAALLVLLVYAPSLQAPFLVPKFAALEVSAALGLVSFALQRATIGGPRWDRAMRIGVGLVIATTTVAWAVAATRSLGAPYAVDAMARWGSFFGLACGASVIADLREPRQRVLETVTIACSVVAAIGLLQHLELAPLAIPVISRPGSTFGNRNLAAEVMAVALPLGLGAVSGARRKSSHRALLGSVALMITFLAVTRARGAWFGAACGVGTMVWLVRERVNRTVLAVAVASAVLAAIAAAVPGRFTGRDAGDVKRYSGVVEVLQESIDARSTALRTRLGLWRRTLAMVRDHPLLGVGPGNWPVAFPRYAEPGATRDGVLSPTHAPRQAHDDLLERAAETGVPGLLALGVLAAATVRAVRRRRARGDAETRMVASAAAGALVALIGLAFTSFPLEMPGTLALAGLALGLVASGGPDPAPRRSTARAYVAIVAASGVVLWAAVRGERSVRSSAWLGAAERAMRQDLGSTGAAAALGDLQRALEARPIDYRAELRMAQMLLREQRPIESAHAAERALAVEPHAPNAWAALAAAELAANDDGAARRDATEALTRLQDYPFALDVRAQASEREGELDPTDRERINALAIGPADDETAREARAVRSGAP